MTNVATDTDKNAKKDVLRADDHLWTALEGREFGFERNAKVGKFSVDFISVEGKVIIDVDSWWRAADDHHFIRDCWLKEQGYTLLKFWSFDIRRNLAGVMRIIEEKLKRPVQANTEG